MYACKKCDARYYPWARQPVLCKVNNVYVVPSDFAHCRLTARVYGSGITVQISPPASGFFGGDTTCSVLPVKWKSKDTSRLLRKFRAVMHCVARRLAQMPPVERFPYMFEKVHHTTSSAVTGREIILLRTSLCTTFRRLPCVSESTFMKMFGIASWLMLHGNSPFDSHRFFWSCDTY